MITILKSNMKFEFPNNEFVATQDTPDGMYFKFKDGTELIINADKNPMLKTIPAMLMKSTAANAIINFNDPQRMLSFSD